MCALFSPEMSQAGVVKESRQFQCVSDSQCLCVILLRDIVLCCLHFVCPAVLYQAKLLSWIIRAGSVSSNSAQYYLVSFILFSLHEQNRGLLPKQQHSIRGHVYVLNRCWFEIQNFPCACTILKLPGIETCMIMKKRYSLHLSYLPYLPFLTCVLACMHRQTHSHTLAYTHTYVHIHTATFLTHWHKLTCLHTHTYVHIHTATFFTHWHILTCLHTHTYVHIHTATFFTGGH